MKKTVIDLFCGAGGASMGLYNAGYEVVGVDIENQPNYPFTFIKYDALKVNGLENYDLVWASPPCQAYSWASKRWKKEWPDLVNVTRERLVESGRPYIIENVVGAPLINPIRLCGEMFGLRVIRHRLFESNINLVEPPHKKHKKPYINKRGTKCSWYYTVVGNGSQSSSFKLKDWQRGMGIDWMTKKELVEAIPPAYSEYLGNEIKRVLFNE